MLLFFFFSHKFFAWETLTHCSLTTSHNLATHMCDFIQFLWFGILFSLFSDNQWPTFPLRPKTNFTFSVSDTQLSKASVTYSLIIYVFYGLYLLSTQYFYTFFSFQYILCFKPLKLSLVVPVFCSCIFELSVVFVYQTVTEMKILVQLFIWLSSEYLMLNHTWQR